MSKPPRDLPHIGWREWVELPDFGVETIKVKVDIGARTSSLHAFDLEEFQRDGEDWVRFEVHPEQRDKDYILPAEAPLLERRKIRNSGGHTETRPVILTRVALLGQIWPVELTLTRRDAMGFRMLLGRRAVRDRFLVDPGLSFLGGRRAKGTRTLLRPTRDS